MQVPDQRFEPFLSPYLSGGYRQDQIKFDSISVSENEAHAVVSVPERYEPSPGEFHFTAPLAFIAIAQLAVVAAHIDAGLTRKVSEVLVRSINLRFRREIRKYEEIHIALSLSSRRSLPGALVFGGKIDVESGSFIGDGRFHLPITSVERE